MTDRVIPFHVPKRSGKPTGAGRFDDLTHRLLFEALCRLAGSIRKESDPARLADLQAIADKVSAAMKRQQSLGAPRQPQPPQPPKGAA